MPTGDFASLRADIQRELGSLDRLKEEAEQLLAGVPDRPSFIEIRTAGSILHDFYTGIEKIFRRIALEIDGGLPLGLDWHADLLLRMSAPIEDRRPAVITEEVKELLSEYLRFRHLFRNLYGFELRWDRCQDLVSGLPAVRTALERQFQVFLDFLRSLEKD